MFVNKIHLQNFKRFTDLTIDLSGLAAPPRLVLMIGANGSGKSSVFDAFESVSRPSGVSSMEKLQLPFGSQLFSTYLNKGSNQETRIEISLNNQVKLGLVFSSEASLLRVTHEGPAPAIKTFYGRSALRSTPRLLRTSRQAQERTITENLDKPLAYIEIDQRFENDLDVQNDRLLGDVFNEESYETKAIRDKYIKPINDALARIFTDEDSVNLQMYSMKPPLNGNPTNLRFRKGTSDLHYDLLSHGEKEVVNILFNLLTRRAFFDDTIYFIDELDAHLNTALQYNLLKEITENWLPENCQLWTASHSLGFIKYAQETEAAAILDFDQIDFDLPQTLMPLPKDTTEIFEIAVPADILPSLFKDRQVFLCENKNDKLYQRLEFEGKIFLGVSNKDAVYYRVKTNQAVYGLIDRDYLTEEEISRIREKFPRLFVLKYYAFENYLYHHDNLAEAISGFEVEPYKQEITKQKNLQLIQTVADLKESRSSYKVLRDENLTEEEGYLKIAQELQSDDFETFYPHFSMKSKFTAKPNVRPEVLVGTAWFRNAIGEALEL
ncbi:MAG: AAA family ATPase [Acidobacteria bacterium]|nr:AAA family ATPase [Acidobacteriota bacterium]